jgi:CRP-like cAMP-binding protein
MTLELTQQKLLEIGLFEGLPAATLNSLAEHCRWLSLASGDILFNQGDDSGTLYFINRGQVELVRDYKDGEKVVIATLGRDEVIGELSMIGSEPRTASVIATEDTELVALDRDVFFQYLEQNPTIATEVLIQLSRRLRKMTLQIRELAVTNAPSRIASLILFLAEENGRFRTGLITANFRHHRMARAAGVDVEYLRSIVNEWAHEGFIGLDGRRLLLHDEDELIEIAGWSQT